MLTVQTELELFQNLLRDLAKGRRYRVEEVGPHMCVLVPGDGALGEPIPLTLMGLTHGNETVGLGILNELLAGLLLGPLQLPFALGLALGNVEAALKNCRFLEKDLNRCFASPATASKEQRRAHELAPLLKRSQRFIDFHQTFLPSAEPFFIFPYTKKSYEFAREVHPDQAIVTHWGASFSQEGMCSDEFVNRSGGVGITIETGQAGLDRWQIAYGFMVAVKAIQAVAAYASGSKPAPLRQNVGSLYTWAHVQTCPATGPASLKPGLFNFRSVQLGEELGSLAGEALLAPSQGRLLFPKYFTEGAPRPTELFRIIKEISPTELPS